MKKMIRKLEEVATEKEKKMKRKEKVKKEKDLRVKVKVNGRVSGNGTSIKWMDLKRKGKNVR